MELFKGVCYYQYYELNAVMTLNVNVGSADA